MAASPDHPVAPALARSPSASKVTLLCGVLAVMAGLTLLRAFDPSQHRFFPRCTFHALTGLDCPGCGGQRAVHYLLRGEITAAFHANALLLSLLPIAMWLGLRFVLVRYAGQPLPSLFLNRTCLWLLAAAVILFGIVRNVSGFEWLRP